MRSGRDLGPKLMRDRMRQIFDVLWTSGLPAVFPDPDSDPSMLFNALASPTPPPAIPATQLPSATATQPQLPSDNHSQQCPNPYSHPSTLSRSTHSPTPQGSSRSLQRHHSTLTHCPPQPHLLHHRQLSLATCTRPHQSTKLLRVPT